ncbi:GTP-binding protein [Verrucomicrobium sp. GAS474]|uniref:ribosome biogenesis GTPase Der n=1 Tax=Verrucomicrobium sp. GAS474 TaxID=1882831 RepID=UPI00087C74F2|nr:ribosome biogenesis GTPase Der [Verrucomicrobium sp. GAS474]SDT95884.1 GTP-binding protein [Verrucomicrobium sp. GAS474]
MPPSISRTVAIVGRPNVGKSAIFNRITGKQISLVHDQPGVTRDRISHACRHAGHGFELLDTGGIGLGDKEGFAEAIEHEVSIALATAQDILFVVDGRDGLTPLDQEIAKRLRTKTGKKGVKKKAGDESENAPAVANRRVILVVNKLDVPELEDRIEDFRKLGFPDVVALSAAHGLGLGDLMEILVEPWGEGDAEEPARLSRAEQPIRLAFLGRPNVGKSSMVNALLEDSRTIVSPVSGTTRDAIDVPFTWRNRAFTLIDTAGMRQNRKVRDPLETKMTGRSVHVINRANVCVLVLDAMEGVSMQDKKIGGLIDDAMRPVMIVVNKWDLVREQGDATRKKEFEFIENIKQDLFFLEHAPILFTSAKTGERVESILKTIEKIEKNRRNKISTSELNDLLQKAQEKYAPPLVNNRRFKIYYATHQIDETQPHPTPTILAFINSFSLLTPAYRRYIELKLREKFPLEGCPVRWVWKEKQPMKPK